jgi:hypothetical protein
LGRPLLFLDGSGDVDEIASIAVDAKLVVFEAATLFCFVLRVELVIFS